ncbi:MAG: acetyl-CoA hydrolase/transferase C-terminal domain-containing protein [Oscillospiraceae bacterium]|nr:acetyl-CoA hydrolase/transferase C-terminal domain-containing protein [Oscillospiraceae bacterium]
MYRQYLAKTASLQECYNLIQSGDRICFAGGCNQPVAFMKDFHTVASRVTDVECIKSRSGDYEFVTAPGMNGHINTGSPLYGEAFNEGMRHGNTSYIVCDICDYSRFVTEHNPCNTFIAAVTPMDEHGNFQVSLNQMWERECIETCRKIILEVNENLPRIRGGLEINIQDVTALYEATYPLPVVEETPPTAAEETIADYIADLVSDGDCLELGTGTLSNVIAQRLSDHRELGLHTEWFNSGAGRLIEQGIITGEHKNIDKGLLVASAAWGDQQLYDTLASCPRVAIRPASYVCDPKTISSIDNMIAINTLVEMDLTGQVCSESIGTHQISGSSGNLCFSMGAIHSKEGKSILCFPSMTRKGISKINCQLSPGANVTIPRNYVDYIVTEYGVARMKGRSVKERTEQLIRIAHPAVREELTRYAMEQFYI